MKVLYLALVISCILLVSNAEKIRKLKKYRKPQIPKTLVEDSREVLEDEFKIMEDDEKLEQLEAELKNSNDVSEVPQEPEVIDNRMPLIDPCMKVHCGAGRICQVDAEGEPQCICIPECPVEVDSRRKVCSSHNETWSSDCAVYQQRCLCNKGDPACKGEEYKHVHIEYYGECRDMPQCTEDEMADFPRRMRDWLFNIMRDMADREELSPHYLRMQRDAESNLTRRWTNAAVWKFCDLDGHPPDRSVSRHELFPIRAPLMALEHCIAPFLNGCDADDNHKITLQEWAKCLQLDEEDIDEKCDEFFDNGE